MQHEESPYRPPVSSEHDGATPIPKTMNSSFVNVGFGLLPILGGVFGFGGCIFAASMIESRNTATEPILSYGQQFGLISLPICTMIGAAIGLGFAFLVARRYAVSILLLLLVSLAGWNLNNSFWNDQIARYGRDQSEAVLYYPPLAFSGLAFFSAVLVAFIAAAKRQPRVT
jgi:hypothetical protein